MSQRIDTHQHFWSPTRSDYPWMPEADPILQRPFAPSDLEPLVSSQGVAGTIVVQAAPTIFETEYMLGIADATDFVLGVVGWVDMADAGHKAQLNRLAAHPKFLGVRPMVQDIADDDWILGRNLDWAFSELCALQLTFDALGYWMRRPGPNAEVVVVYTGAVAPEAIAAVGSLGEYRRDIGLLTVTSADRLNAGWTAAQTAREAGHVQSRSHVERLLDGIPPHCAIVTVTDAHPATLGWIGSVAGHRTRSLGVEHFGQTGTIADLYRHYGIDTDAILRAVDAMTTGRPVKHLKAV